MGAGCWGEPALSRVGYGMLGLVVTGGAGDGGPGGRSGTEAGRRGLGGALGAPGADWVG